MTKAPPDLAALRRRLAAAERLAEDLSDARAILAEQAAPVRRRLADQIIHVRRGDLDDLLSAADRLTAALAALAATALADDGP